MTSKSTPQDIPGIIGTSSNANIVKEDQRLSQFKDLLDSLSSLEDKKKVLWLHIYENAILDRANAYSLMLELTATIKGNPAEHTLNGPILSKYIERMSRANDQILKLAELVQKAQEEEDTVNPDEIWAQLEKK